MGPFLELIGITKRFGDLLADDDVNLEVRRGEVHAIVGENGAGKTTLVNIIYGLVTPTSGEIRLNGRPVRIRSPRDAIELGIGMVHQHFMLIPALTVVENVILGTAPSRGPFLDLKQAASRILKLSETYGLQADPWARVWQLSVGAQQRVEILKALFRGADLLILDEPTAVLTPQETDGLFRVLRRLASEGHSVIFISHKLNEVMAVSDRITVLRGGRVVGTVATSETTPAELSRMMVGREVLPKPQKAPARVGRTVLEIRDLKVLDRRNLVAVDGVNLEVRAGEIVGIGGVDGNGQQELMEAIAGLTRVSGGRILINGVDVTNAPPRRICEQGLAFVPGDRHLHGLVLGMSIMENLILKTYYRPPFRKGWFLDWASIARHARQLVQEYEVKAAGENVPVQSLSGGNQQKVGIARELSRRPDVLLAAHPTRGLDIGATEFVHREILKARDRGCAVLLVSTELEELLSLSDRVAVMYAGRIVGFVDPAQADLQQIGLMMAGGKRT